MTYPNVQLLINNEWRAARGGATLPVHNPADGSTIGTVAKASTADLDDALAAAAKGFEVWKNTPAVERSKITRAAAALLREPTDAIATVMTMELSADGTIRQFTQSVGGGADWSSDSGRTMDFDGRWAADGQTLSVLGRGLVDFTPAAAYEFSGTYLVTHSDMGRLIWQRR